MKCHCKKELIWGGDHDLDDDGTGICTNYSCHNDECEVDTVFVNRIFVEDKLIPVIKIKERESDENKS